MNWKGCTIALIGIVGLALAGCASDDGDEGTTSTGAGVTAATNAFTSATLGLDAMGGGDFSKSKTLRDAMRRFNQSLKARRANVTTAQSEACPDGGNIEIDLSADGLTTTFHDCVEIDEVEDIREYKDGTLSFAETNTGFTLVLDLTERETRISDDVLLEEDIQNLTMTGTFGEETVLCDGDEEPTSFTVTINGSSSEKEDEDGDGVLEEDESQSFDDFTATMTVEAYDSSGCEPADSTASISGIVSVTDNVDSDESFTMNISSENPLVITEEAAEGGTHSTVNGTFSFSNDDCSTGTISIATIEPLFQPDSDTVIDAIQENGEDDDETCPTAGQLSVTIGETTGTATFTETGGVHIDSNGDGTVDEMFDDCDEASACA